MIIDETVLTSEMKLLKTDFDNLTDKIQKVDVDLNQMKANLNALHGAIQQVEKLIKMTKDQQ
jgi:hypothetical protein